MARIEIIRNDMYFDEERLRAAEVGLDVLHPIAGFSTGAKEKFNEVYDVLSRDLGCGISNISVNMVSSNVPGLSAKTFFDVSDIDGRKAAAHLCIEETDLMGRVVDASLSAPSQDPSNTIYAFNEFAPSLITVEESVGDGIVRATAETALFVQGRDENATPDDQYLAMLETIDASYPSYLTVSALHNYLQQLRVLDSQSQAIGRR